MCPLDEVCNCVPIGSSVFDLGCGTGAMLQELARSRSVRKAGGCETSSSLLDTARVTVADAIGGPGTFLEAKSPPECLKDFDCITLIDVLHHIPKEMHSAYISQAAANMSPGAKFILKDIDADKILVWFNRLHDAIFAGNGFQEIGFQSAKKLIEQSGLSIQCTLEVRRLWYPHYFIVAEK